MKVSREKACSVHLTIGNLTDARKPIPTTPSFWASRQCPYSNASMQIGRIVSVSHGAATGHLCSYGRVSGSGGIYRLDDLIVTVKGRRKPTVSKYASGSLSRDSVPRGGPVDGETRKTLARREKAHCGTATLAGWSDVSIGPCDTTHFLNLRGAIPSFPLVSAVHSQIGEK